MQGVGVGVGVLFIAEHVWYFTIYIHIIQAGLLGANLFFIIQLTAEVIMISSVYKNLPFTVSDRSSFGW